jgi:uncharacterized coiled-coil DUF342 family protein
MKLSDMMQYANLKEEIKDIEERIAELENQAASYPKGKRAPENIALELIKCRDLLRKRSAQCAGELFKIEKEIGNCKDSYIRRIMRYRFCDRLSWTAVARRMGGTTGDSCRILVKRYLEQNDK